MCVIYSILCLVIFLIVVIWAVMAPHGPTGFARVADLLCITHAAGSHLPHHPPHHLFHDQNSVLLVLRHIAYIMSCDL